MIPLTVELLQRLLRQHIRDFYNLVGTESAQFFIPLTGQPRLRVAVPPQFRGNVPKQAAISHEGETVKVPLELDAQYEKFSPQ